MQSADVDTAERSERSTTSYRDVRGFGMCRVDYGVSPKTVPVQHAGDSAKTLPVQRDEDLRSAGAVSPVPRHRLRDLISTSHVVRQPTLPFKQARPIDMPVALRVRTIDELVSCSARRELEVRPADVELAMLEELIAKYKTITTVDSTKTLAKSKSGTTLADITDFTKTLQPDDDARHGAHIRPPRLSDLNIRHAPDISA